MTGGSNIRAIGPEEPQKAQKDTVFEETEDTFSLSDEYQEEWDYEEPSRSPLNWIVPTIAISAVAGWTAFFAWAYRTELLSGGTPQEWAGWITSWAIPVLLVTSMWLLAMRNSRVEAARFGEVAHSLSNESVLLEQRLTTINRELSLAREFLGSQSLELESLGRVASERLSQHADHLQSLVSDNGKQVEAIASVSTTALENMGKLRDDLPVIANSAKDVSNQIGTAGRTAHDQIAELIAGFERLNSFGKASETQVASIHDKIEAALTTFEAQTAAMEELAATRFAALQDQSETFRTELDGREVEALAAMRRRAEALAEEFGDAREGFEEQEEEALRSLRARLTALREETGVVSHSVQEGETAALESWETRIAALKEQLLAAIGEIQNIDEKALASANAKLDALRQEAEAVDANIADRDAQLAQMMDSRHHAISETGQQTITMLGEQLEKLDGDIAARREAHLAEADTLAERSEIIAQRIGSLRGSIEEIAELGASTQASLSDNADALSANLAQSREALESTDQTVGALTEASVRLLELIQASAQHSRDDLPDALGEAEMRLNEVVQRADQLKGVVGETADKSEELSSYVLQAQDIGRSTIEQVDALHARLDDANSNTADAIAQLHAQLAGLNEQSDTLSDKAQSQLRDAIATLEEAARSAPQTIGSHVKESVDALAMQIGEQSGDVLDRRLQERASQSLARLEDATAEAGKAGREIAVQLRDQLTKVNELAGNLENRVARAREQAEEQVGNDFARRMALITESLNSNAIDIAKAMASDVTDTAWASYLRGDRGIFTRRAVRLLDNTEARDIAEIYDDDPDFRENVSRYIHDFEAMLRSMLSTRDGNALGVTLLSSDMGKLYVALAQSIERLRD